MESEPGLEKTGLKGGGSRRFYYCVKKRRERRNTSFITAEGGFAERERDEIDEE